MQHRTLLLCVLVGLTFVGMNISLSQVQSWQQIGLAGTDLEAVEVNSDGYIYAAVHPGGLYRTTDNGGTWVLGTMTPTTPFFHDIKEYTSGDLFAGAGDYGVYRSTDKGVMWQRTALDTGIIWEIHIDSRQYIYAGGTGKFHRSTDGGVNWSETTGWTHAVYGFAFKPGYMFIGIHAEGVFRSTNDGATWTTVNNSLGNIYVEALTVATNGDLYVGTGGGIYKSTNNGDSWSHLNTGTIGRVHSILITLNGYMYAGSDSGVVLSSDMGGTWEKRNTGLTALDATDLALGLDGNLYLATWGGGVHKSIQTADPVQFWQQTGGPPGGQVNCLGSTLSGDLFAGTANLGVHRSANQGASWSQVSPMQFYSILMKPNGYIFGGTTGQGVQRSTDGGTSWGSVNTGFAEDTAFSLAMAPNGDVFAGGGEGKVFRSTNDGGNWSQLAYSMAGEEVFAFTFKNPGYIFVGTYGAGVFRSTDDGASWSQMNAGLTDLYVQSLARNAYGHVFAGTNGGVFRTTDNGANWTKLNYSWSSLVHVVSINSQGELYATSESGVYMSTDYGTSWTQVNGGLTNLSVGAITFDQEGYGYVGTWGSEVFRTLGSRGTLHNYEYRADENTVLLFHLNESSGSLSHDHSSYGNHGIVSGSSIVAGRYGNGRGLNGSGNYISVSDAPSLRPTLVTVEAWVYSDNYTGMPWGIIVTKERTSSSFSYRLSMAGSTGQIYFGTGISQNDGITSSAVLGNGKWYHVAGTFDGSMLRVYVNGVL
ncbi:MAG: LamG-like jellyroll fold domain-containing protein, partial [Bacteroidota bacterium]